MTIPAKAGSGALYTKTLIQGTGATVTSADGVVGNYVAYDWAGKTSKLLGSTFLARSAFRKVRVDSGILGGRKLAVQIVDNAFGTRVRLVHGDDFIYWLTSLRSCPRARCSRDRTVPTEHPTILPISS